MTRDNTIEQARQTSAYWKAEHLAGNKKIEQQEAEIARLRGELTEALAKCDDEDWEYRTGDTVRKAQAALNATESRALADLAEEKEQP